MRITFIVLLTIIYSYANSYNELLFNGNCVTCHFKNKSVSAPSIAQIKQRYITAFPNKKDFVSYMSKWVLNPNQQTSLMTDSIEKYEIMPVLGFDLDSLEKIAIYIYENDFE
jgi:hypothetical protein